MTDCLSRLYEKVNVIFQLEPIFSNEELSKAQKEEKIIRESLNYVSNKKNFDVEKLGQLKRFRKQLHINSNGLLQWKNKIVLPKVFHSKVLEICHDHPTAGHFKEDRTWSNVTEHYF